MSFARPFQIYLARILKPVPFRAMHRLAAYVPVLCVALIACPDTEQRAERARTQAVEALAQGERDTALAAIASLQRATPDDPQSIREHAALLIHAGEAPRVVWLLEDAIARFPDEPSLRLLLAEAALLVNDPVRAEAVAAQIAPAAEGAAEALVLRARAAMALGDLETALARFELAERSAPERPELRAPRIAALLGERRFDEAARALEEAETLQGDPGSPLIASLSLALHQYRSTDARRRLRRAARDADEAAASQAQRDLDAAITDVGALARANARDLGAWLLWIPGLVSTGRAAEAAEALESALSGESPPLALYPLLAQTRLALAEPDAAEAALRKLASHDPPTACLPLARFLAARDRADEAIAVLETARDVADDPELAYAHAELLLGAQALEQARETIEGLPDTPPRELLAARLVLARGDAASAARRLERLAPELDTAPTHYWLARALEAEGDRAGAERRYALAALRSPSEPGAYIEILRLARERGAWREVAAAGQQLVLRLPALIDGWEALVAALIALGEPVQAESVARRALVLLPDDPGPFMLLARALRGQGRHGEAIEALASAPARFREHTGIVSEQVLALAATGRTSLALELADRNLESQPEQAPLHYARGVVLFTAARFDEGSSAIDRALTLDSQDPRPLRTRCQFSAANGRHEVAHRDCERYLALRPDDAEIHFALGSVLDAMGDPDAAIAAYRRAAELDTRAAAARNNLATLLFSRGDLDAALEVAQEAYALAGENPHVLDTLGELYVAKGLHGRAIQILERAHALAPELSIAELHLALAYQAAGRRTEARRHLSRLLERSEASPIHQEAKRALANL